MEPIIWSPLPGTYYGVDMYYTSQWLNAASDKRVDSVSSRHSFVFKRHVTVELLQRENPPKPLVLNSSTVREHFVMKQSCFRSYFNSNWLKPNGSEYLRQDLWAPVGLAFPAKIFVIFEIFVSKIYGIELHCRARLGHRSTGSYRIGSTDHALPKVAPVCYPTGAAILWLKLLFGTSCLSFPFSLDQQFPLFIPVKRTAITAIVKAKKFCLTFHKWKSLN